MNKIKKSKYVKKVAIILPIIIIALVIILALGSKFSDRKYNNKLNSEVTYKEINISEYRIKTIFDKKIKQRITKKLNHNVFIGENDKQIENGYYDVKTYIQNNKCMVICLNKLWKDFDKKLYEEDYITEIAESINEILAIKFPLNKIYDYILMGYLAAKNDHDVKEYVLKLDNYVIKGKILEKEFVMSIYKK